MAAEIAGRRGGRRGLWRRFNEAAANGRGNRGKKSSNRIINDVLQ